MFHPDEQCLADERDHGRCNRQSRKAHVEDENSATMRNTVYPLSVAR